MLTATKQINMNESDSYFAKCYKIKYENKYKREHETSIDTTYSPIYLRTAFESIDDLPKCKTSIELSEEYRFQPLPCIPLKTQQERSTIYISGASGMGKSWLINSIVKDYKKIFPTNKVYYFTKNNAEKDRSLEPKAMYNFINVTKFIETFTKTTETKTGSYTEVDEEKIEGFLLDKKGIYDNSFFIFDDIASLEKISKEASRIMQLIIDIILENKRKSQISIAILSHVPSNYKQTALLIREMKQYIAFPSNLQVKSDRILNSYLGLNTEEIRRIVDEDSKISKWIVIDNSRRLILTQRACYFLNSTPDFATIDNLLSKERDGSRDKELATVRKDKGSGNKPTQQRKQKQPVKANK